ncbi:DUF4065 domain-containing protein [Bacillus subtilis]
MAKVYSFMKRGKNMLTAIKESVSITNVSSVANAFLSYEPMTHKKLQKLCYYAYAWHLTLYKKPLFDEKFEAWIHGPVARPLYSEYKEYGWNPIPSSEFPSELYSEPTAVEIVKMVFNAYGHLDGDELEYLTHTEAPWLEAREGLEPDEISNRELNDKTIVDYYYKIFEKGQND